MKRIKKFDYFNQKEKEEIVELIKDFYYNERGEEIGLIETYQLIDFFNEVLAPKIYNKAIDDTRFWLEEQFENLNDSIFTLYKEE